VRAIFERDLGGSPIVIPSSNRDLLAPELEPLIARYYRGSDASAHERIKLFKLIWDAIGSEFGARHELYERNYSGNHEQTRLDNLNFARTRGDLARFQALAEQCLSDYDLSGWTSDTWLNPDA
jgi:aromatic ring hydroxylase